MDKVVQDGESLLAHTIEHTVPFCVIYPENDADIQTILKYAQEYNVAVVPWGSGTFMELGYTLQRYEVCVDLSRMPPDISYSHESQYITISAGITLRHIQSYLSRMGRALPIEISHSLNATAGGLVAAGMYELGQGVYGGLRAALQNIRLVDTSGTFYSTANYKTVWMGGLSLNEICIGSLGTLGIITAITWRTVPESLNELYILIGFPNLASIQYFIRRISKIAGGHCSMVFCCREGIFSAAAEIFGDDYSAEMDEAEVFCVIKMPERYEASAEETNTSKDPQFTSSQNSAHIFFEAQRAKASLILNTGTATGRELWSALAAFTNLPKTANTIAFLHISVTSADIVRLLTGAQDVCREYGLNCYWLADGATGNVWLLIFDPNADSLHESEKNGDIWGYFQSLHSYLSSRWQNVRVLWIPDRWKNTIELWKIASPWLDIIRTLKHRQDPLNILNPGKLFRADNEQT